MIDLDVMQAYVRDANPIPQVADVDPDELASFVAVAHRRRAAIMQAPIQHPAPASTEIPQLHGRRNMWAFAVAFLVAVAAIGVAALVARGRDNAPATDEPIAPPTTTATEPASHESLTWSRVPHDDALFDPTPGIDVITSITAGGPGFVAVGTTGIMDDSEMGRNAAVWLSEDGVTWSRVPNDTPPLGGPLDEEVQGVTVGGPGLVAVGFESEAPLWGNGVVWISDDGMLWSRVPDDEAAFVGAGMLDVTAGGPGLVAVGGSNWWTSVDGLTWNRVRLSTGMDGSMKSVTVGGPGLVAVGVVDRYPEGLNAAVWLSLDGLTWSRVPHDEVVFGGATMFDVAVGGPGLVAVGSAGSDAIGGVGDHAAVWTSPDGFTWTRVPGDPEVFGGEGQSINAVVSAGAQLVAVGGYGRDDSATSNAALVWTSTDGLTWTLTELDSGLSRMYDVAATSRGVIAVGQDAGAAAIWVATEG